MEISQQRKSWIWGIPNHVKDNVLKKASKCAENKTTSRKDLGTSFQNVCSEADEGLKAREEENREKEKNSSETSRE